MAKKESSFDIVSQVDLQEVDNAFQQTSKEMQQRYDFKGTNSSIEFNKSDKVVTIEAPSDFVANQIKDIFNTKLVKRGVDLKSFVWADPKPSGTAVKMSGELQEGIDKELAKKISAYIRDLKLKVKPLVEGDKLRVTSASIDALQEVIQSLKNKDFDKPLQFINYR